LVEPLELLLFIHRVLLRQLVGRRDEAESVPEFAVDAALEDSLEVIQSLIREVEALFKKGTHES
jgi:hypothetical protein